MAEDKQPKRTAEPSSDDGSESLTRVFYVVDSIEDNEELFETFEDAEAYQMTLSKTRTQDEIGSPNEPRIRICMVRNAFREDDGGWNYDDLSDTFNEVKTLGIWSK